MVQHTVLVLLLLSVVLCQAAAAQQQQQDSTRATAGPLSGTLRSLLSQHVHPAPSEHRKLLQNRAKSSDVRKKPAASANTGVGTSWAGFGGFGRGGFNNNWAGRPRRGGSDGYSVSDQLDGLQG